MRLIYGWSLLIILLIKHRLIEGKTFYVSNYGAYPNDNNDDTNAIQLTIDEAINHGFINDVVFGNGIYIISSAISINNAVNLTITGQGIDQTFLVGTGPVSIFSTFSSQGVKLTSFSIDYNPLPFTAGYVVDVNDKYLDVQIIPPHQTDVGRQVVAILRYDPVHMRPAFGPNTYEIYQHVTTDTNTTIVSPGILRLPLAFPTQFLKGDPIVARYVGNAQHPIYAASVTDLTIQSITLYASWSISFLTASVKRLNVINYHVKPRDERWMSSNVDCIHFIDTREYISISDTSCQAMGDDGLNVHAVLFLVKTVIDSNTIIIEGINGTGPLDVGIGTTLEFSSDQQPFTIHGNGTVASSVFNSTTTRIITFTSPVNISVDDWVCVADTPNLIIRNFTVSHNRGRGALLETRNIDIRQSLFNRTSGPAILFQPSMYWHEGPGARNVTLVNNIFIENNEGIIQEKGIISIRPVPRQTVPVISDIRIESSTFYFGTYSQGLLQSDNGENVFLNGNYISMNSSLPLVSICNSRNLSAENNCLVNGQTKIDQIYTFDDASPCVMNLSSLIDLPVSSFNSSFPPPVLIQKH